MVGERILIVEDEAIFAREVQRCLEKLDYQITGVARTGEAAIQ